MDENEIHTPLADVSVANRHAIKKGQKWGPRCSLDCQWICPIAGSLSYESPRRSPIEVFPGELLFIPAGEQHSVITTADGALTGFHGDWRIGETWKESQAWLPRKWRRKTLLSDGAVLIQLMTRMADIFEDFPVYKAERLRCLATEVLFCLVNDWTQPQREKKDHRLEEMLKFMRVRLPAVVSRSDLAEAFELSPAYINQLFKRELGLSPGEWVRRERCRLAHRYLLQNLSVSEVAERIGFADPFHFSRVFKQVYGVSPSKIRPS